jgi:hypothetical protein
MRRLLQSATLGLLGLFVPCGQAGGSPAPRDCERFLRADDVLIDIRDEDVKIVIVNTSDKCTLLFADNLKTGPGQDHLPPNLVSVRVESPDGAVLSETKFMGEWYTSLRADGGILTFTLTRLPAGQTRVKRESFTGLLWWIDNFLVEEGRDPMPWGKRVVLQVRVVVFVDPDAAAGRFGKAPKTVEIVTAPVLYTLPKTPPLKRSGSK